MRTLTHLFGTALLVTFVAACSDVTVPPYPEPEDEDDDDPDMPALTWEVGSGPAPALIVLAG